MRLRRVIGCRLRPAVLVLLICTTPVACTAPPASISSTLPPIAVAARTVPGSSAPISSGAPSTIGAPSTRAGNKGTSTGGSPPTAPGAAAAALTTLAVKGRAPLTGYDRALFGQAWSDDVGRVLAVSGGRNGCDQRNDVLRRDLTMLVLKPKTRGCVAATGTLMDPYTGARIAFVRGPQSSAVQIDHVVALADAWQKGAQQWDDLRRKDFAGDPLNLLAVKGSANQSKGAGDAATWLPPNKAVRCSYVARIIAVKVKYGLWVSAAEKTAIARVLSSCPTQALPTDSGTAVPAT